MRDEAHRNLFLPVMGSLAVLAWLTLWLWERSPYGRYLDHGDWTQIGIAASICRALPGGEVLLPAFLYIGGWVLMTAAMMLPTTFPLLEIFRRLTLRRADRRLLLSLVILGYLLIWALFGLAAHLVDFGLNELVVGSPWLTTNGWVFGAAVLCLAGVFQFSQLKYRCLDKCRMPLSFVMERWRGRRQRWHAFVLGVHHGAFCVGCCWALMMLMFVVGTGSVGWMLVLGAIMAVEKNMPWGRKLSAPLGIALIAGSGVIVWNHALTWPT
jgi:predicted metal-binding membrane protein